MKLIIIGLLSGIISGMGIGGGSILIPSLILFNDIPQIEAQGINLVVFIPIAIIALFTHKKEGNLDLKYTKKIIIGGIIGAVIGSLIALKIDSDDLRKYFGFFLLFIGVFEFFKKNRSK